MSSRSSRSRSSVATKKSQSHLSEEELNDSDVTTNASESESESDDDSSPPLPSGHSRGFVSCSIPYSVESGGVPVFRPDWSQFQSFEQFIQRVDSVGFHYGMMKVIPPKEYCPNKSMYENKNPNEMMIQSPVRQKVIQARGMSGAFRIYNMDELQHKRSISVSDFDGLSAKVEASRSPREKRWAEEGAWDELERRFWSTTLSNAPLYGADSPGTLFDPDCQQWNVGNLPSLLHAIPSPDGIPGVSRPFLYWGQWKSMFAWHVEDVNLYSINYVHHGSPKQWYGIAPRHAARFDRALETIWPQEKKNCSEFIRHKEYLVSPTLLKDTYHVPVMKTRQERGEFMVLWPQCYHQGFNYGFNCAESVNFATNSWFRTSLPPANCYRCLCRRDTVWVKPQEILNSLRKLQYLWRKEQGKLNQITQKKSQKTTPSTTSPSSSSKSQLPLSEPHSSADSTPPSDSEVPADYSLDDSDIWLDLPTLPQELYALTAKYLAPSEDSLQNEENVTHSTGGRSMAGRSMSAVSSSSSSSSGFLFDEDRYNELDTGTDEAGFIQDANVVHCTYPDCTQPLHRNQAALMKHYSSVHSASAREKAAATKATPLTSPKKRKSAKSAPISSSSTQPPLTPAEQGETPTQEVNNTISKKPKLAP